VARIVGGKNFNRALAKSGTLLDTKSMKKKKIPRLFSPSMKNTCKQLRCIFWRFPVLKLILRL